MGVVLSDNFYRNMRLPGAALLTACFGLSTCVKFWGDKNSVANGESWDLADHHGMFGDFKVERCVRIKEGFVRCKYMVHYDKLANEIQLVGRNKGMKCVKAPSKTCKGTTAAKIDRNQHVTERFLQHCISITHNLWAVNSLIKAEFINEYKDKDGKRKKCHMIDLNVGHKWKG